MALIEQKLTATTDYRKKICTDAHINIMERFPYFFTHSELVIYWSNGGALTVFLSIHFHHSYLRSYWTSIFVLVLNQTSSSMHGTGAKEILRVFFNYTKSAILQLLDSTKKWTSFFRCLNCYPKSKRVGKRLQCVCISMMRLKKLWFILRYFTIFKENFNLS